MNEAFTRAGSSNKAQEEQKALTVMLNRRDRL